EVVRVEGFVQECIRRHVCRAAFGAMIVYVEDADTGNDLPEAFRLTDTLLFWSMSVKDDDRECRLPSSRESDPFLRIGRLDDTIAVLGERPEHEPQRGQFIFNQQNPRVVHGLPLSECLLPT